METYKLGELLKKLRGHNSLTTISEKTDGKISRSYLDTLEKGINASTGKVVKPNPDKLKILSEVYSYSYEELLKIAGYEDLIVTDNKEDQNEDEMLEKMLENFRKLSDETKEKFIKMLNIR